MRCPQCDKPLALSASSCPHCGVCLDLLGQRLGPPPSLEPQVTDIAQVLSARQISSLERQIRVFERGFRDVHVSILTHRLPPETRLASYAFWLFNSSPFSQPSGEGGDNHHILFLLDANTQRANITAGYGLEPFVSAETLDEVLNGGETALAAKRYYAFLSGRITALETALHIVGSQIPEVYGIHPALVPTL